MAEDKFDREAFVSAAREFRHRLEQEQAIAGLVRTAMSVLGDAAVDLVAISRESAGEGGPVLTASISESRVEIQGGNRNIVLAPAYGVGNDSRLSRPRFRNCGQVLVFGHLTGHPESDLLCSLRIYDNGEVTDGDLTWHLDSGIPGFLPFLAHLIRCTIFESDVFWPELADLPPFVQKLPLLGEQLEDLSLKRPCVGFECSLTARQKR